MRNIICSRIIWLCYVRLNSADGRAPSLGTLSPPCVRTVERGWFFRRRFSLFLGESIPIHQILHHGSTRHSLLNGSAASLRFIFPILCCFSRGEGDAETYSASFNSEHLKLKPVSSSVYSVLNSANHHSLAVPTMQISPG